MPKTSDMKQTVSLSNITGENISRHQMIDWVNTMVNGNFKKIEEMSSGVAYCQMMEMISPSCINMKRVKMSAKLEHECFHNMKLFQGAFTRLKMDKTVPLDRLIKGRFQDNFEFLQWFKKFFDTQAPGLENIKSAANAVQPKPIVRPRPPAIAKEEPTHELQATIEELNTKIADTIEKRDTAYEKLHKIEILLTDMLNRNEDVDFCNRVFEVLYKTDQNENGSGTEPLEDHSTDSVIDDPNEGLY